MKITIEYESKYSLSTVKNGENILTGMAVITEGSNKNVQNIFSKNNNFLENIKELNKYYPNFQYADITENTVVGILCRLVGEIRRLDMLDNTHPVLKLRNKITFKNENVSFQNENVLLHTTLKEVQNNAGGLIDEAKSSHFLLSKNALSETLLSVFEIKNQSELIELLNGLKNNDPKFFYSSYLKPIKVDSFLKEHILADNTHKEIILGLDYHDGKNRLLEVNGRLFFGEDINVIALKNYILQGNDNPNFKPASITEERKKLNVDEIFNVFGFLFAKKISFLRENNLFKNEFETSLNGQKTSIRGLAPGSGSITIKDYYTNFVSEKKMAWTMPYSVALKKDLFVKNDLNEFNAGAKIGVTKECGVLTINLNLSKEEEEWVLEKIENAGVNTFNLGKKGLAYVSKIELENT